MLADTAVSRWFGAGFSQLHPLLQELHRNGGVIAGPVEVELASGLGRPFARAIARRLGVPAQPGAHRLQVEIGHRQDQLLWNRCFDGATRMDSTFLPSGCWPEGLWIERTGPVKLGLAVEIIEGGWHWRCRKAWVHGIRLPLALFPRSTACKRMEQGLYRFQVSFSLPVLGVVLAYGGLLERQGASPG